MNSTKKFIIIILTLLLAAMLIGLLVTNDRNTDETSETPSASEDTDTTSDAPTAQEDFTSDEEREPGNSINERQGSTNVIDNSGNTEDTDTSNAIVSSDGSITVYQPEENSTVSSGFKVSGESTLSSLNYRMVDSASGVIGMGQLNVVNGKFSAQVGYSTSADEGRLDLFGTRDDGSEFGNISIPLKLN